MIMWFIATANYLIGGYDSAVTLTMLEEPVDTTRLSLI